MSKIPTWFRWALLILVLGGSLLIGSKVFDAATPTLTQRATALESRLKCPSCQDLSVAQSTSASSLAVRAYVVEHLNQGWSDEQIVTALESRYGNAILLTPSGGGLSTLLWLVPLLLGAAVIGVIVAFIIRQRRQSSKVSHE